jgi:hypothetical protein
VSIFEADNVIKRFLISTNPYQQAMVTSISSFFLPGPCPKDEQKWLHHALQLPTVINKDVFDLRKGHCYEEFNCLTISVNIRS